jgi:NADPH2:quinone reductase
MRAIRTHEIGGPEVLHYEELPIPEPGPSEVLVRVAVAGVNFIDTYHRNGLYPVALPFTPGIEAAGEVMAVGAEVEGFKEGDQVVYCLSLGGYSEYATVESWKLVRLLPGVTAEAGVTAMCQGMTAHYLTTDCYTLREGETALVHAAAGGVGLILIQLAKLIGARVIGTVSTEEKSKLARQAGADDVIIYTQQDFESEVKRLTDGEGVSVVYESVGKTTFFQSLNCLRPRGYMVLFGQSSGPVEPLDPQILNQKGSLFLTRPGLFHYAADAAEVQKRAGAVLDLIQKGQLAVRIGERLPLSQAAVAHRMLESRQTSGKVLLIP